MKQNDPDSSKNEVARERSTEILAFQTDANGVHSLMDCSLYHHISYIIKTLNGVSTRKVSFSLFGLPRMDEIYETRGQDLMGLWEAVKKMLKRYWR
ncbi:hypothetical protein ACSFC1_10600 [Pseudothermotoga sp. U03pept]|uniref:hypothetical protein n=1 Tax=Pseudothermotoga sp. U03pept TaxID=3447012 RepID=UPI00309B9162